MMLLHTVYWVAFSIIAFAAWFYARNGLLRLENKNNGCTDPVLCLFPDNVKWQKLGYQIIIGSIVASMLFKFS